MRQLTKINYEHLFASVPGCYLILTTDFTIVAVSDNYLAATNTKRENIIGKGLFDVFPDNPDDPHATGVANLTASLHRAIQSKAPDTMAVQKYDIPRPQSEGGGFEERYWSPQNSPVLDESGKVILIVHCVTDVTQQKKMEQMKGGLEGKVEKINESLSKKVEELEKTKMATLNILEDLEQTNSLLDSIIENIPNMIFLKDARELRFVRFNKAGEQLLGYGRKDLIGKNDYDFFPKEQADAFTEKDRAVLVGGVLVDIPVEPIQTREMGERFLHTKKIPLKNAKGEPEYLLGISADITYRIKADKAKSEFISLASHQLRTPLSAVRLALGTLLKMPGSLPQQLKLIDSAYQYSIRMAETINTLLSISLAEEGKIDIKPEDVRLAELLEQVHRLYIHQYEQQKVRYAMHCEPGIILRTDHKLLIEIIANLQGNALRYTLEGGSVEISVYPETKGVRIAVRDSGIGISKEEQQKLFTKFFRGVEARKIHTDGTGLGLYLVHSFVTLLGGSISVQSEEGTGTTFTLHLPSLP